MVRFNPGDVVRRKKQHQTSSFWVHNRHIGRERAGANFVVLGLTDQGLILQGVNGGFESSYFELVDERKITSLEDYM